MTKRQRRTALYFVLAALLLNILIPLIRGAAPPGELYGVLGTIAGYLLVGERKPDKDDGPEQLPPPAPGEGPDPDKATK